MGSATEEEFKEKLLWNVKREVSASSVNELLGILTNKDGAVHPSVLTI